MKITERTIAEKPDKPLRFQEFGAGLFITVPTRSALKKAIKKGLVLIDGQPATTAKFIHGGEVIELIECEVAPGKRFEKVLKVLYEDDYLAVILKPKGISTSGNRFATISNCLEMNLKPSPESDATIPFPVHRLDYDTSGLLIIGKTASVRRSLHDMFEKNQISKMYHAVCVGHFKKKEGFINSEIDGKEAFTLYKVLKSVPSERFDNLNLVELKPQTGRTHQLRRHLLELGNPIMGDKKYFIEGKEHKGYGLYLHATSLEFRHPVTGKKLELSSELPKTFTRIFKQ